MQVSPLTAPTPLRPRDGKDVARTTAVKPGEYTDQLYQDAADMDPLETVPAWGCPRASSRRASLGCGCDVLTGRRGPGDDGPAASVACTAWQTPPAGPW
jgi:hypothetical protein